MARRAEKQKAALELSKSDEIPKTLQMAYYYYGSPGVWPIYPDHLWQDDPSLSPAEQEEAKRLDYQRFVHITLHGSKERKCSVDERVFWDRGSLYTRPWCGRRLLEVDASVGPGG